MKSVVSMGDVGWTDLSYAFNQIKSPNHHIVRKHNTTHVTKWTTCFLIQLNLDSLNLSPSNGRFDTSNVESMRYMLWNLYNLDTLNLDVDPPNKFLRPNVVFMDGMFLSMQGLSQLNLNLTAPNKFDTSKVESMALMFSDMRGLTSLNLNLTT